MTRPCADTEGPQHGTHCWVAVEGVSERSELGRTSAEKPRTRRAKQNLHGVGEDISATRGTGGLKAPLPKTLARPVGQDCGEREGCGEFRSAGQGAIAPERTGTERASLGGVSLAGLHTNSEGPRRGTSLLGRTRRRVGGLGLDARPERPLHARGAKQSHAVTTNEDPGIRDAAPKSEDPAPARGVPILPAAQALSASSTASAAPPCSGP